MVHLIFVGEKRSQRAKLLGVRWQDEALALTGCMVNWVVALAAVGIALQGIAIGMYFQRNGLGE